MYVLTKRIGCPIALGPTVIGNQPVEVAALTDAMLYAYADGIIDISPPPSRGDGIDEAPKDGRIYGRKNESWMEIVDTGSASHYTHHQNVPSVTWVIVHNLSRYPSIVVTDSAGSEMIGSVVYNSANHLTIVFSYAFAGIAQLN